MHYCCVKYCQNKSTNARLFQFPEVKLQDISREQRIAWFRAIKFKNTNVSIDFINSCRICESQFKSEVIDCSPGFLQSTTLYTK